MTLKQLEYFLAIAENGSLARAAESINISVPPLSQSLKRLEEELGSPLFLRKQRGVVLTDEGKILLETVSRMKKLWEQTVIAIKERRLGFMCTLRLGSVNTISNRILPFRLSYYNRLHPNTTVLVEEAASPELLRRMDARELDLCIVRQPFNLNKYGSAPLYDEKLVGSGLDKDYLYIMCRQELCNNLNKDCVSLRQLQGKPIVIHSRYVALFSAQCHKLNFKPNIVLQNNDATALLRWAAAGLGCAVIPFTSTALAPKADLVAKKIVSPSISSQAYIIWPRARRP